MKEKMEIISLNTTKVEFEEELNLDARLQRLESNELKLIRAGETCVRMDCPTYVCPSMWGCSSDCNRCDGNCAPACEWDGCTPYNDFVGCFIALMHALIWAWIVVLVWIRHDVYKLEKTFICC